MIELRNRTRNVFRFPVFEPVGKGIDSQLVAKPEMDLVIGDSADETLEEGVERSELCPSPIVQISEADFEQISGPNKLILEQLIETKQIERRKVA